jgi:hypothetical protein
MKRLTITATAVLLALGLTACASPFESSSPSTQSSSRDITVQTVDTPDGRAVTCILWDGGYNGGISCDWDEAR